MAHQDISPVGEVTSRTGPATLQTLGPATSMRAANRAAGAGPSGPPRGAAADGVQLSEEAREGEDPEEARRAKRDEEAQAEEQTEAQRKEEEKAKQIEELMKQVQKALDDGDYDRAGDLLRKVQALVGGEGDVPDPGSLPTGSAPGGGGAPVSDAGGFPGGGGGIPGGGGGIPGGGGGGGFPGGGGVAPGGGGGGAPSAASAAPSTGEIDGEVKPPNGKIVPPLDNFRVTSEFGPRWGSQHGGIDLAAPSGTPIKAVMDGTVSRVANDPSGYGKWVEIRHSDGSTSRYAHMSAFSNVKQGQEIGAGTVIGAVGSTGRSTGPHLHFEWRKNNGQVAVNPRGVFNWV